MFTTKENGKARDINEGGRPVEAMRESLRRVKGEARAAANSMRDDLNDMAHHAGRQVRDMMDSAEDRLSDAAGGVAARIRDNPIQSSAIALGVGLVIGMLFRR